MANALFVVLGSILRAPSFGSDRFHECYNCGLCETMLKVFNGPFKRSISKGFNHL